MKYKITGAIFDMDGTLIDSLGFWEVLWSAFGRKFLGSEDFRPSAEDDKAVRTLTTAAATKLIHDKYKMGRDADELLAESDRILKEYYETSVCLKAGVPEFLDHLQSIGVKMCIASATDKKLLNIAFYRLGLDKYFDTILSCADIGKGKDQPDIFFAALDHLGTDLETTWVFEDSAVSVDTAHKAGFKTVGIYDKFNYGHELMEKTADQYIADGETILKLI